MITLSHLLQVRLYFESSSIMADSLLRKTNQNNAGNCVRVWKLVLRAAWRAVLWHKTKWIWLMYSCGFNPAWRTERGAAYKDYVCWTWPTLSSSLPYFSLNHAEKGRTRALPMYILYIYTAEMQGQMEPVGRGGSHYWTEKRERDAHKHHTQVLLK